MCKDILEQWSLFVNGDKTEFIHFYIAGKDEVDEKGEPLKTENPGGKLYLLDHDLAVRSRLLHAMA